MKSDYPGFQMPPEEKDEIMAPPSRLLDEKISGESDVEAMANSALAPTGLNNPFWN